MAYYCAGGLHWIEQADGATRRGTVEVDVVGLLSFATGAAGEVYVLTAQQVLRPDPAA